MSKDTDIVYAAEKPSIAGLLARYLRRPVSTDDIHVHHDPAETGSFLVSGRLGRYRLSPAGRLEPLRSLRQLAGSRG